MTYVLSIAEKPSVAKGVHSWIKRNVNRYPQFSNWRFNALFGHMLEPVKPEIYNINWKKFSYNNHPLIPTKFINVVKNDPGIIAKVEEIRLQLAQCLYVIHLGDPDREGQLLVDELLDYLGNTKPVQRVWLNAIDDKVIEKALNNLKPNSEFLGYRLAAEARQQADWLIGFNFSPLMTLTFKKYGYSEKISVGRVQAPVTRMIVDRTRANKNFISKAFYDLIASFGHPSFDAKLIIPNDGKIEEKATIETIRNQIVNKHGIIINCTKETKVQSSPLLFSMDELQGAANVKYGYTAAETLKICQGLYDNGILTYPRSDNPYMAESQFLDAPGIILELRKLDQYTQLSPNPIIKSRVWDDEKMKDHAHHGIVPIAANINKYHSLDEKSKNIFNLVALQYIIQFYPPLTYNEQIILIQIEEHTFRAIGREIVNSGWKSVLDVNTISESKTFEENEVIDLPMLKIGEKIECTSATFLEKKTAKPKLFTESSLIKAMKNIDQYLPEFINELGYDVETSEKMVKEYRRAMKMANAGLGTVATRANVIETIKARGYIKLEKKNLVSTALGDALRDALVNSELEFLSNPITTARYEQLLTDIQNGRCNTSLFMSMIYNSISITKNFEKLEFSIPFNSNLSICPKCQKGYLREIKGKSGSFTSCSNYIECNKLVKKSNNPQLLTEKCLACSRPLIEREGKFGKFKTCSGYPECKWRPGLSVNEAKDREKIKCPKCNLGYLIERAGKDGDYFSCSNYPRCSAACTSNNGKPDLDTLIHASAPGVLTLNEKEIHGHLHKIAMHAYPKLRIPDFTIKIKPKELRSKHGDWSYSSRNNNYVINIYNLSRKYEHTLATTVHELAHHCHFALSGKTNHKREFYEILKHLLETSHELGYINLVETYDIIDSYDREKLEKYFGEPTILNNNKADFDLIKFDYYKELNEDKEQLKQRGFVYSTKEKKWILSLHHKNALVEIAWLEKNFPNATYQIFNNKINTVDVIYFCIIGNFHAIHPDILTKNGFYLDEINGWVNKFCARDIKIIEDFCTSYNIKPKFKGFTPRNNLFKDAHTLVPILGKKSGKTCPNCGGELIVNKGKFGEYIGCSKFLMGCKYIESVVNVH